MAHVLFDTSESQMGLYGKPMARNAQLWTEDARLLLDGPRADRAGIARAADALAEGGLFGYRFQFPAMRVGDFEVYWHRPLVAYLSSPDERVTLVPGAPLGDLTGYRADLPDLARTIELWPRLRGARALRRRPSSYSIAPATRDCNGRPRIAATCSTPVRRLAPLCPRRSLGGCCRSRVPKHSTPGSMPCRRMPPIGSEAAGSRTNCGSGWRWQTKPRVSHSPGRSHSPIRPAAPSRFATGGRLPRWPPAVFPTGIPPTAPSILQRKRHSTHHHRDLEALGDHLLTRHRRAIAASGMSGRALAADLPFHWRTDFDFVWSGGWLASQGVEPRERDLLVIIPGRDRRRAVIMADHYDTAYMEDRYRKGGERLAAPGADDNTSATAALLMAAPVLLEMSRLGQLGCDVWLVHLTGEEFPADCLGARHLAARLVAGDLKARLASSRVRDLSGVKVEGIFVLDMVAHDKARRRGVFQIAPGVGTGALRLALEANRALEAWNALAPGWDRHPARRAAKPRRKGRLDLPPIARHPRMIGEVRPHDDPRSTLYNTDAQIFSDAGIPAVLFMEDYDINRQGYHDSHDTMAGIDLAYGAALVAIAIETVARVAVSASLAT